MELIQLLKLIDMQGQLIVALKEKIELLEQLSKVQESEINRLNNAIQLEKIYKER